MSRVGHIIQDIRNKKGISKKQLAKKLGVAEKFIDDIELGKRVIPENILDRISKIFGENLNDNTIHGGVDSSKEVESAGVKRRLTPVKEGKKNTKESTQPLDSWGSVFTNLIKKVPIYDYNLTKIYGEEEFLLNQNKINGHNQDKVVMLKVEDSDMTGFRIGKDDLAFCFLTSEFENDKFYLLEHKGVRTIKKVRKLDSAKVMLIRKETTERNEIAIFNEVKLIAKIIFVKVIF